MKIIISNTVALNGGDFAILDAIINLLKQTYGNDCKITVFDNAPEIASQYYPDINFQKLIYFKITKKSFGRFRGKLVDIYNKITQKRLLLAASYFAQGNLTLAYLFLTKEEKQDFDAYSSSDIVISTGGTYLVENYDLTARFFDYKITLALKKPLVFFTQSLGPYKRPENRKAIKEILDKANLILLRDKASYKNLEEVQVNMSKAKVCADVVFADADPVILKSAKTRTFNNSLRVGISVRDWGFFKGRSSEEGMSIYNQSIAAICEYITIELGGEVVFISTCQGIKEYWKDDSKAAANIYNLLTEKAKSKSTINHHFHNPEQLKNIIKDFDVVVATRMHFAIQSLAMGVPVLPIAYEFKTKELFSKLIEEACILDINTIEINNALTAFKKFLTSLPNIREELFTKVEKERQSALKPIQYLKEELSSYSPDMRVYI